MKDYQLVSPSLNGILMHGNLAYEGLRRPGLVGIIFDRPRSAHASRSQHLSPKDRRAVEGYCQDLYGILMKKISQFAISASIDATEEVRIQAILQEFIKVKKLLVGNDSK